MSKFVCNGVVLMSVQHNLHSLSPVKAHIKCLYGKQIRKSQTQSNIFRPIEKTQGLPISLKTFMETPFVASNISTKSINIINQEVGLFEAKSKTLDKDNFELFTNQHIVENGGTQGLLKIINKGRYSNLPTIL
jgi:hypothetical protein